MKALAAGGHSASELIRMGLRVVGARYYRNRRPPSTGLFTAPRGPHPGAVDAVTRSRHSASNGYTSTASPAAAPSESSGSVTSASAQAMLVVAPDDWPDSGVTRSPEVVAR